MRIVISVLLACSLVFVTAADASARTPVALGYSTDPVEFGDHDMAAVDTTIRWLGVKPAMWTLWSNWGSRGDETECLPGKGRCAFPTEAAAGLLERGITPMIWWQPVAPPGKARGEYARYIRIINGRHDDYIRQWATDAMAHEGPIILRFAHEMNGRWYPWALTRFDNTPKRYKKAWQHIWRIFRDVGATNVRFMWSPAQEDCNGCEPNYRYESFYPGNRFVDYVGLNGYNSGRVRWKPLSTVLERPLARFAAVTRSRNFPRGKPVILGEVGSGMVGGSKAQWIIDGYQDVFRRWPRVKAMAWFDVDMGDRRRKDPDWRLIRPKDRSALDAYRQIASLPRFRGLIP